NKSDHGGEEDADDRNQQRVEQTDEEHPGVGVGSRIRNQVLADVETGRVGQEPKPGRDPLRLQVGSSIGYDFIAKPDESRDKQDLQRKAGPARPPAERAPQPGYELRRWFSGLDGHSRSRFADQRIGGAY